MTSVHSLKKPNRAGPEKKMTNAVCIQTKPARKKRGALARMPNVKLNVQTRKVLGKHYAAKYRSG